MFSVRLVAIMFPHSSSPGDADVVARYDEKDPTSISEEFRRMAHDACEPFPMSDVEDLSKLRVGIPQVCFSMHAY